MDVAVLEPREVLRRGLESMLTRLETVSSLYCHGTMGELLAARHAQERTCDPNVIIVCCIPQQDVVGPVRRIYSESRVLELLVNIDPTAHVIGNKTIADGYLVMHDVSEPVLDCTLQALMRGELPLPIPVANFLFERARSGEGSTQRPHPSFTACERNVIDLLLEGRSNREIAQKLGISVHSAKRRVSAVLQKANAPSRSYFVAQMLRDGHRC